MTLRRLASDSAIYGGANFLSKLLAFFTFPLIAAALSPQAFGVLELITTTTALLGMACNCGLNNAVSLFYWDVKTTANDRSVIVTSGFFALVISSFLVVIIGLAAIPFLLPTIEAQKLPITWVALVSAILLMAFHQWTRYSLDVIRLHFAPWRFLTISLTSNVVSIVAGLLMLVVLGLGIDGLLGAQAFILLLVIPLGLFMIRKDFHPHDFNRDRAIELVRIGYPYIFSGLAFWLFASMDRWMLAAMSSVEEVGIYSVAFRFASVVLFVSAAFSMAWNPVAIKVRTDNPERYREIYGQILVLLLFVMLVVGGGVALFSGELIAFIMPSVYQASALPLSILCLGIVLQATQQVTIIGISLEKKTYIYARLAWFATLANLILNYFLIPIYSSQGAAWATTISFLILTTSSFYYTQKYHPIIMPWKPFIIITGLGIIVGIVAITLHSDVISWKLIAFKSIMSIVFFSIGLCILPLKKFKNV